MDKTLTTFYIVRHGETDWNLKALIQGQTDIPLNETGKEQARHVAEVLKAVTFDLAFSSDLMRAKETAEIIVLEHKLAVQTTTLLRERRFGSFEGKEIAAMRTYDELFNALAIEEKKKYKYDQDSESDDEITTRLITFIRETAITHPGKNILVGTHGGVMRAFLIHIGFLSYEDPFYVVSNGAYVKLTSDGIEFNVRESSGIKKSDIWN